MRAWRDAPKHTSSSASRAAASEPRSARIANGVAARVRATLLFEAVVCRAVMACHSPLRLAECCRPIWKMTGWEPANRLPVFQAIGEPIAQRSGPKDKPQMWKVRNGGKPLKATDE